MCPTTLLLPERPTVLPLVVSAPLDASRKPPGLVFGGSPVVLPLLKAAYNGRGRGTLLSAAYSGRGRGC
jgi:hypothetical protein